MGMLERIAALRYPATKQELVEAAVAADVSQALVEELQRVSCEQYPDAASVERELADLGGVPRGAGVGRQQ